MKNFFKSIKLFILSLQEQILTKRLKPHLEHSFTNKDSKTVLSGSETLTLNSIAEKKILLVRKNVEDIFKASSNNPLKLLEYIEAKGTKVFRIKNASKILKKIGEEEGLITELHGFKAFYLNLYVLKRFSLNSEPMFVISIGEIEPYYMLREFYKWYALNMGLAGFNFTAQENFKKYLKNINDPSFKSMNYKNMLELKEAIARDAEANEFVISRIKEKEESAKILKKLNSDDGTI